MSSHDAYEYDGDVETFDASWADQYASGYRAGQDDALLWDMGEAPNLIPPVEGSDDPFWKGYEDAQVAHEQGQLSTRREYA